MAPGQLTRDPLATNMAYVEELYSIAMTTVMANIIAMIIASTLT